jgi:hypothetical protein
MQVIVQPDASATIIYDIVIDNSVGGGVIDIIDIATPHDGYDIQNMKASIDGVELNDIRVSEVIDTGVEIHLNDHLILPGEEGSLHFEFTMPDMVFQDTTRKDYASLQIANSAFDQPFIAGDTDIWITVHMLPGIQPEEVQYQEEDLPFTNKITFEDHTVVGWNWPDGLAYNSYLVGTSFPQRGMTAVVEQSIIDLAVKWLEDNPLTRLILTAIALIIISVAFFRFTGGTGLTFYVPIVVVIGYFLLISPVPLLLVLPLSLVLFLLSEWALSRRKIRYLPAVAQVEGGGIKRGLTAPEAGVILELPLNKILTLVIFGLLEKGLIVQTDDDPLEAEVALEYQVADLKFTDRKKRRRRLDAAQKLGTVIRTYEHGFLDALELNRGRPVHTIDFSKEMKFLIQHTADRIDSFDLSDTQDYYRRIIARAMEQAKSMGEIPERERYIDKHLQWLLLDDDYPTVFRARNYHYRPIWIRPFASSDRMGIPSSSSAPSTARPGGKTTFSQVASSFAGWTENTMGNMADAIAPGALQVKGASGIVNLGGADKVTGDVFKAMSSSSGRGSGGGGGSCACACAGCACACACAGGGR